MGLRSDSAELQGDLIELRRQLHQIPELGLDLPRTQQRILDALQTLPLEITTGVGLSSITAVLRGAHPGPVVLLRGDMDALPVTENSNLPFTSRHPGAMHACGHDLHSAGLVGAAHLLAARRNELSGDVVFMFQPGEEGFDGARHMIDEGVLTAAGRPVDHAYGLHVLSSDIPRGMFASRPGALMAASDSLVVRVIGVGGHGSRPHSARDPISAASEMVTALQTMVTRRFDVFDPVIITVGVFAAGTKRNIIPDEARFEATVRTFSPDRREQVGAYAIELCERIAAAHGLEVQATFDSIYPVTVNDVDEYRHVAATAADVFGSERFVELASPDPGSEDFSRVLAATRGSYLFLGTCVSNDPTTAPSIHSPLATFDDSFLGDGAAMLAELAARRLTAVSRSGDLSNVATASAGG